MIYLVWTQGHGLEIQNYKPEGHEVGSVPELVFTVNNDDRSIWVRVNEHTVQPYINFLLDGWAMAKQGITDEHTDAVEMVYEALIEAKERLLQADLGDSVGGCWTPERGDRCDCPACGGAND